MVDGICYWFIDTGEMSMTLLGGPLKPVTDKPGYVYITKPDGTPAFIVRRKHVHPTNQKEFAQRLREDAKHAQAEKEGGFCE